MSVNKTKKSAFAAHFVEWWTIWLQWVPPLNRNPRLAWLFKLLTPINIIVALVYKWRNKPFALVDEFKFAGAPSETYIIRNFGIDYLFDSNLKKIRQRILKTVLGAIARGVKVIGLGALNKDERVAEGGKWVVDQLERDGLLPKDVSIVHGDTLTAAVVLEQALLIIDHLGIRDKPVFLIGPTSKIGRPVAIGLARRGIRVRMLTSGNDRFKAIQAEAGSCGHLMEQAKLEDGADCPFWITGKFKPSGGKLIRALPKGAVVLNFAVPDPLMFSSWRLWFRKDIVHLDGGLLAHDPALAKGMTKTIRLRPGLVYACHAGTMVHGWMGWDGHEIGPVDIPKMGVVYTAAMQMGFRIPPWTSFLRPAVLPPAAHPAESKTASGVR